MFHPPPGPEDEARISEKPIPVPKRPVKSESNPDGLAPNCPQGEDLFVYVNECFDNGSTKSEVLKQLLAYGYNQDQAETIVDDAARWRFKNSNISRPIHNSNGIAEGGGSNANMWIGGAICLIGIVVTVGSCMAAGEGGGRYTIAYGAIIWGAIQFFRGMSQSNQNQ
jgi:hypothetical protein